ncbi:MAG: hypothetical protein M1816_001920 [Peltula sp. TS41687]|nr:MAG: hypothetical protein M1816_001920 [Peltula sp. TS41687]
MSEPTVPPQSPSSLPPHMRAILFPLQSAGLLKPSASEQNKGPTAEAKATSHPSETKPHPSTPEHGKRSASVHPSPSPLDGEKSSVKVQQSPSAPTSENSPASVKSNQSASDSEKGVASVKPNLVLPNKENSPASVLNLSELKVNTPSPKSEKSSSSAPLSVSHLQLEKLVPARFRISSMANKTIDYTLYLVADYDPEKLGDKDLVKIVQDAVEGGVNVVQLRDRSVNDTADVIRLATRLHDITSKHKVPLLISDRVDIALAVGAEGVHLGSHGSGLTTSARKLLGDKAIIGVTVSSADEAQKAARGGATYLAIGPLLLSTNENHPQTVLGTTGTKNILTSLSAMDEKVAAVIFGGIDDVNVQRVVYQSKAPFKGLDGVVLSSVILEADDPKKTAAAMKALIQQPPQFAVPNGIGVKKAKDIGKLLQSVPGVIKKLVKEAPCCHNMTNLVVQNFAANVNLAIGASPIMTSYGGEVEDLLFLGASLLINIGLVTPEAVQDYTQALVAYNGKGAPVVFDPVGAGATRVRRSALKQLMGSGYFDVIKGNEGEIKAVCAESGVQQRDIEFEKGPLTKVEKARLVKRLAVRERNVVVMTGVTDYLSDGERTFAIENGHHYLGKVTGTGCTLGTAIASCLAVHRDDKLLAVLAAMLLFEIASEHAALREDVKGPGTFIPGFIDELYSLTKQTAAGSNGWLAAARVQEMEV